MRHRNFVETIGSDPRRVGEMHAMAIQRGADIFVSETLIMREALTKTSPKASPCAGAMKLMHSRRFAQTWVTRYSRSSAWTICKFIPQDFLIVRAAL